MALRALVIESDAKLRQAICRHLLDIGMEVCGIEGAAELEQALSHQAFEVAVCDADPHPENGFSAAARLRMEGRIGIVMLTACNRREDRILGLSVGVDQLLVKPVDLNELGIVLRNLYKRLGAAPAPSLPVQARPSAPAASWRFDAAGWTLTGPGGGAVRLSMSEHLVMHHLVTRAGQVASREELLEALAKHHIRIYSRNLDAMISRLRKKIERAGGERLPILSARNIGYVFTGHGEIIGEIPLPTLPPAALLSGQPEARKPGTKPNGGSAYAG